jgi:hypothetical protein
MAATDANKLICVGKSSAKRKGSARKQETGIATACHWCWELEGTGAGAKGVEGEAGLVQQEGVAQL